jgi:hypothetical protein
MAVRIFGSLQTEGRLPSIGGRLMKQLRLHSTQAILVEGLPKNAMRWMRHERTMAKLD